jgi:DNA-binding PadR family transcriptional regulator
MNIFSRKKVTKKDLVLELLLKTREMSPSEIVKASQGKIGRGTIYNILTRLELEGYLTARDVEVPSKKGILSRRFYSISEYGRRIIDVHCAYGGDIVYQDASLVPA